MLNKLPKNWEPIFTTYSKSLSSEPLHWVGRLIVLKGLTRAYCKAVYIPFIAEALK
jgi:hypothetical protein